MLSLNVTRPSTQVRQAEMCAEKLSRRNMFVYRISDENASFKVQSLFRLVFPRLIMLQI